MWLKSAKKKEKEYDNVGSLNQNLVYKTRIGEIKGILLVVKVKLRDVRITLNLSSLNSYT